MHFFVSNCGCFVVVVVVVVVVLFCFLLDVSCWRWIETIESGFCAIPSGSARRRSKG